MLRRVTLKDWLEHYSVNYNWKRMKESCSSPEELLEKGIALCFTNEWGSMGYAVTRDMELVGLWSVEPHHGVTLMSHVVKMAKSYRLKLKLNCFDGYLTEFYKQHGFVEYDRIPNYVKYAPDVVFMRLKYG